ncbi:DNA-binding transcription factor yap1 [Elasticomyces elasticus]|nr:DNA-binding transcription factor yap1 [Elasticomyces elasticus]
MPFALLGRQTTAKNMRSEPVRLLSTLRSRQSLLGATKDLDELEKQVVYSTCSAVPLGRRKHYMAIVLSLSPHVLFARLRTFSPVGWFGPSIEGVTSLYRLPQIGGDNLFSDLFSPSLLKNTNFENNNNSGYFNAAQQPSSATMSTKNSIDASAGGESTAGLNRVFQFNANSSASDSASPSNSSTSQRNANGPNSSCGMSLESSHGSPGNNDNGRVSKLLASCDECRVKKLKCSGDHPSCVRCSQKKLTCVYSMQKQIGRRKKVGGGTGSDILVNGHYGQFGQNGTYPPATPGYGPYGQNNTFLPATSGYGHYGQYSSYPYPPTPLGHSQHGQYGSYSYPPAPLGDRHITDTMGYSQHGQYGSQGYPPAPLGDGQQYNDTHTTPPTKQHWRESTDSWRADVRQIACNILLAAGNGNGMSKVELVDAVLGRVEELARINGTSIVAEMEMLTDRIVRVLETSSLTFIRDDHDDFYRLTDNPTQVMDPASQMALFSKPTRPYQKQKHAAYGFTISCIRDSGPSQVIEGFTRKDMRAHEQMKAYWKVYGDPSAELRECRTVEALRVAATTSAPDTPFWTSYCYNDSSSLELFAQSPGQRGEEGNELRLLLAQLNDADADTDAIDIDSYRDVTLLYSGVDGGSSNVATYSRLCENYPRIRFRLVLVMKENRAWHLDCLFLQAGMCWASFDVAQPALENPPCEHHFRLLLASNAVQYLNLDFLSLNSVGKARLGISTVSQQPWPASPAACAQDVRPDRKRAIHAGSPRGGVRGISFIATEWNSQPLQQARAIRSPNLPHAVPLLLL